MAVDQTQQPTQAGIHLYPALKWSVYVVMVCTIFATLFYPFHRAATATANPDLITSIFSNFVLLAAIIKLLVMVFAFIVFLRWLFCTVVNNETLGVQGLRFSATASVAWLLVPVVNILAALPVMLSLAKTSFSANGWNAHKIILMTLVWWFAALLWVMDIKHPVDLFQQADMAVVDYTLALTVPVALNYLAFFVASILFLLLVRDINRAQLKYIEQSAA